MDAAHSAYVTCTGYRVETWDAEAVDWSVESTVTTPSGDAFSYVHTGDGVTAKRLVWTFGARTAAFSPTHVWAGGDLIDPLDFSVAANWRTASGQAVSAAPGVDSVVYVPPAVAPTGVTTVEVVQAFHVAALHVGDPAGADKGYARLVFRTSATNEVDGALVV